jgi:group II intron reverse transcriptase/maturase
MTVDQLDGYVREHWPSIKVALMGGTYQPQPVRRVEIPKPGGGVRMLGIPTVVDRLIQQALHQILSPIFEEEFSEHSYGFRPGRSTHDAVRQAQRYVSDGRRYVVDLDLEKFFDRVNHDILMARLARKIEDKRVLALIRRYLQAGMMEGGTTTLRTEGTPQGGPLSPLLSNVLLTDLDRELERRGHAFCRYADDCNVYVRSKAAGERVMASLVRFLERRLKLTVNAAKSAVARPWERKFLGYSMTWHKRPRLKVAEASVKRLKGDLREMFRRGRGRKVAQLVEDLTPKLRGWVSYFRLAEVKNVFEELDGWVRRKLRCILWRQKKRPYARARMLMSRGASEETAWRSAQNGRGPWWNAGAPHMNLAFPKSWFDHLKLVSLLESKQKLQRAS